VVADGYLLPVPDGVADVCFSSNVLEHVADPETFLSEMVRVTRPGGLIYLSFTNWFSPWGGHETAPWHYLGGRFARRCYIRTHGHEPKNRFGESLFPVTVRQGMQWALRQREADVLDVVPRYNPRWSWWLLAVPGLREVATWNLAIVLRRR
jgi:SAM-dependent methyltransferase